MPGVRGGAPDGACQGQLHGCGRRDVLWRDAEPAADSAGTTQPASTSWPSTATNTDATTADADTKPRTGLEPHIRRLLRELLVPSLLRQLLVRQLTSLWEPGAQYHHAPYRYTAADLAPIVHRLDWIMYSFIYFCPPSGTSPMPYWAAAPCA